MKNIKELKGNYIRRTDDQFGILTKVLNPMTSSGKFRCIGITMPTHVFETQFNKGVYKVVPENEVREIMQERYEEFMEEFGDLISAYANTRKYAFYGGNGYLMARDKVLEEEYGKNYIDFEYVSE